MKSTNLLTGLPCAAQPQSLVLINPASVQQSLSANLRPLPELDPSGTPRKKPIRHILLGDPDAIRQTIHLLHTLHYTETVLWSPVLMVDEPLVITPAQGEAMSLLRKLL